MSEQIDRQEAHEAAREVPLIGHDAVDGVLRSLEVLEGKPVDEHVAVFESAHEALRAALADAGGRPSGQSAG